MNKLKNTMFSTFSLSLLYLPLLISAECSCETELQDYNKTKALRYKLAAISSILIAGVLGVSVPILGKKVHCFRPENDVFFLIKAFAGGVILSTGFVHILPDAFESLTSSCLEKSWGDFPLTGLVAMVSAMITMMIDSFANSFYKGSHFSSTKALPMSADEEMRGEHEGHVHVHTHATHGHAHGSGFPSEDSVSVSALSDLIKHRVTSQVLEFGIIVHSVIIGISLGASQSAKTIKPLGAALTFHQFFEGMGLGGCISQAKYKSRAIAVMVISFSLTTPIGIASGIGISNVYNKNTSKALMVEGVLNSASAGILIYMVLVDLLAADFMNPRMQSNLRLQLGCYLSLVVGAGCMSGLAQWA